MTVLFAAAAAAAKAAAPKAHPLQVKLPAQAGQPQVPAIPQPQPQTILQAHAAWLTHGVAAVFVIAAIALIVLLAVQTTKQEGLSGTIGGRVESTYGRMGADEQLQRVTGFTAVVFVLSAFILSLTGI
ncbi:MAG TPA: preprotein translocase subunit SecG [Candidatus Acidoferrales bacterium]|nr:preprotein translocase subunit SecG [Candidatus Acidoferrales bacterium]